jgi:hypothetical protein
MPGVDADDGTAVRAFSANKTVQLVIKAGEQAYHIFVNGVKFASFIYRIRPELVTHFRHGSSPWTDKFLHSEDNVADPMVPSSWIYELNPVPDPFRISYGNE